MPDIPRKADVEDLTFRPLGAIICDVSDLREGVQMTTAMGQPLAPGDPAPYFELPAVAGSDTVSLADYRGRSPLFLALMVGLWCPFCRRQLVRLGAFEDKLKALG